MTLNELNVLNLEGFLRVVGPVFEHSPWIADAVWEKRPFARVEQLHRAMCEVVVMNLCGDVRPALQERKIT
jgi:2-oxo-4-hydroxy-4-carboxy--5-ureidoimidazoline (OHCU) decarboxylase